MKLIPLTRGYVAIVDDADHASLSQYKWRASINHSKGKRVIYACRRSAMVNAVPGKIIYMHRQILGLTDRRVQADHRDFDGLNNQRENLRICSHAQNLHHQRREVGNSGKRGVSDHPLSPRWRARINIDGKEKHLGMFDTPQLAESAYRQAAKEQFGEFSE